MSAPCATPSDRVVTLRMWILLWVFFTERMSLQRETAKGSLQCVLLIEWKSCSSCVFTVCGCKCVWMHIPDPWHGGRREQHAEPKLFSRNTFWTQTVWWSQKWFSTRFVSFWWCLCQAASALLDRMHVQHQQPSSSSSVPASWRHARLSQSAANCLRNFYRENFHNGSWPWRGHTDGWKIKPAWQLFWECNGKK